MSTVALTTLGQMAMLMMVKSDKISLVSVMVAMTHTTTGRGLARVFTDMSHRHVSLILVV